MTKRYALRDDQWKRIENLLPGREGTVGGGANAPSRALARRSAPFGAAPKIIDCLSRQYYIGTEQVFRGEICHLDLAILG